MFRGITTRLIRKGNTMDPIIQQLANELNKDPNHVENVVRLLDGTGIKIE